MPLSRGRLDASSPRQTQGRAQTRASERARRRSRWVATVVILGAMGAIGLACGFPSVRFGEIDADLPDADLTEADTSDGFDRAMADVFVEENEAGTRKDGEAKLPEDASCLSADPCDCD
ncbi:MAG TPA: hypothetical protein VM580_02145, partial [Labilithrix sp.]|nr:hypothetical protein [Labilithrix sp.]